MTTIFLDELGEVAQDLARTLREYDSPLLKNLYYYVPKVTGNHRSQATIRCTLQRHCRTSKWYLNQYDLFEHLANGCWRLRTDVEIEG